MQPLAIVLEVEFLNNNNRRTYTGEQQKKKTHGSFMVDKKLGEKKSVEPSWLYRLTFFF